MKVIVLLCLTIATVYGQSCPPVHNNNGDDEFGNDMTYVGDNAKTVKSAQYMKEKMAAEAELTKQIGVDAVRAMSSSSRCPAPGEKPLVSEFQSVKLYTWWYYWTKNCEPCPPNAKYLESFFGNRCHVYFPKDQQVRVARCSYRKCGSPCACGNTKCLPTAWTKVWFFGWCSSAVGGWNQGLNFRYLYLPQDCTCHEQVFYPVKPVIDVKPLLSKLTKQ